MFMIIGAEYAMFTCSSCLTFSIYIAKTGICHDDVIKWKHFPRNWSFVRGIDRSPVDSPRKDQWREALMFSLICAWTNGWVNNWGTGDLRPRRAHYDVTVMWWSHDMERLYALLSVYHRWIVSRNMSITNRRVACDFSWDALTFM